MIFYLGTHKPGWLRDADYPLFVSHRTLAGVKKLPRAACRWALDSGGFSELSMFGEWRTTPHDYAAAVRRYQQEIGSLDWAAPQDWMCEPFMIEKTGLSVAEHQQRTIDNFRGLRDMAPDLPWVPVLQGWTRGDYLRHVDAYATNGIDLAALDRVGIGSVCRRQGTTMAESLISELAAAGIRLHGFGFKTKGLVRCAAKMGSADSMAWSLDARRAPAAMPGCETHKRCSNCRRWADAWRWNVLKRVEETQRQGVLWLKEVER